MEFSMAMQTGSDRTLFNAISDQKAKSPRTEIRGLPGEYW